VATNIRPVLGGLLLGLSCAALVVHPSLIAVAAPPPRASSTAFSPATAYRAVPASTVVAASRAQAGAPRSAAASGTGRTEQEPSSAELQEQQARVAQLRAEAERQAAGVDDAQTALQGAAVLAGQALESYATAVRALQTQQQRERRQQVVLSQAQDAVDSSQRELGRWARQAYSHGPGLGGNATLAVLLSSDSAQDIGTNLTALRRVGRDRGQALERLRSTQQQADVAADEAAAASADAAAAAITASTAKETSEQAVDTQRRLLGLAESSLAQSNDDVSDAVAREAGLRAALLARQSGGSGSGKDNRVTGAVGSCTGEAVEQYANGQIPLSALCPLRTAPGHYLRADAAYAFDRLGQAFAVRFGRAICVTDSYRSYAAQVSVYARKPGLAAVPGTSNHGWGTAVDLCGGIQSFSSDEHHWMDENASLYGWFHPGWAQQNGSKPEPWHWEYGG
jgi:hypothetical protein